jgi:nucleotide-binding universal stress UspA family protein
VLLSWPPARQVIIEVLSGSRKAAFIEFARESESDLIVVGSRKPSVGRQFFTGSMAEDILRQAYTSVLL